MKSDDSTSWEFWGRLTATFLFAKIDIPELSYFSLFWIALIAIYFGHYYISVVRKPDLYAHHSSPFRRLLTSSCPALFETYWPAFWCFHAHAMTPAAYIIRGLLPPNKFHRDYVKTPDGGIFSLDWYDPTGTVDECTLVDEEGENGAKCVSGSCPSAVHEPSECTRPVAVFFPGLTGCSKADYLKSLVPLANSLNYRVVVANYRGMGGVKLRTPRFYCGTTHVDVHEALVHIRRRCPAASAVITIGTSLGGILLGRYLIESGSKSLVDAAFLVSVCYDYNQVAESMESGFLNAKMNYYLTQNLISTVLVHREWFEGSDGKYDLEAIQKATTMREFDDAFLIKMFDYNSTKEYYSEAAHTGKFHRIRTPTLMINAEDDPLSPKDCLPTNEIVSNPYTAMLVTSRGGHIGFLANGLPLVKSSFYLEKLLEQYLKAVEGACLAELKTQMQQMSS